MGNYLIRNQTPHELVIEGTKMVLKLAPLQRRLVGGDPETLFGPTASVARSDHAVDWEIEPVRSRRLLAGTVKATQLEDALRLASPAVAPEASVVPLMNGVDHVARLRAQYGDQVIPGAIRVESERVGAGHVVQRSPFVSIGRASCRERVSYHV